MKSKSIFLVLAALVFGAYCCSPKGDGSVSIVDLLNNQMILTNVFGKMNQLFKGNFTLTNHSPKKLINPLTINNSNPN